VWGGVAAAAPGAIGAVYVLTNATSGNAVAVWNRAADGTLTAAGSYATGGQGNGGWLGSQGAIILSQDNQWLFAVNAGSNTVTSFRVSGAHLTRLQTVPSGGEFPVSVSAGHGQLYVLNAGGTGNVTGYRIDGAGRLSPLHGASRDLGLANEDRPEFITAPADIAQTRDGGQVVVTTKANNAIDVFQVRGGRLSEPVKNTAAAPVPFALAFDSRGRLTVANAGDSSVSSYRLRADGTLQTITAGTQDGQAALCWLVGTGDTLFGGNAGSSTISAFSVAHDGSVSLAGTPDGVVAHTGGGTGGTIDLAITSDHRFLYAENSFAGTVEAYRIEPDHTLELVASAGDLPVFDGHGMEGLVAI